MQADLCLKKLKTDNLGDQGVNRKLVLKQGLQKYVQIEFIRLMIWTGGTVF